MPAPDDLNVFSTPPPLVLTRRIADATPSSVRKSSLFINTSPLSDESITPLRRSSSITRQSGLTELKRSPSCEAQEWGNDSFLSVSPILLGKGGQSAVHQGVYKNPHTGAAIEVAIKDYDPHEEAMHKRVSPLGQPSASGILAPIGHQPSELNPENYVYVMPKCDFSLADMKKSLLELLEPTNKIYGDYTPFVYFAVIYHFLTAMGSALDKLSETDTVHGDIKLQNICVRNKEMALIDFGAAQTIDELRKKFGQYVACCTPYYTAPEFFVDRTDTISARLQPFKIDLYSLGIILFEFMRIRINFSNKASENQLEISEAKIKLFKQHNNEKQKKFDKNRKRTFAHQKAAIKKWDQTKDIKICLLKLATWMTETLPELRPSMRTFSLALTRIENILCEQLMAAGLSVETLSNKVDAFYDDQARQKEILLREKPAATEAKSPDENSLKTASSFFM